MKVLRQRAGVQELLRKKKEQKRCAKQDDG